MAHRRRWMLVAVIAFALPVLGACQQSLVSLTITEVGGAGRVEVAGQVRSLPWVGEYPKGSAVAVRALPDVGSVFTGWTGDASGSANPLALTLSRALAISASFAPDVSNDVITWSFDPATVAVSGAVGGAAPNAGSTTLVNAGNAAAIYAIASDRDWLAASPAEGALGAGQGAEVEFLVAACTAYGSETGTLAAAGGGAGASVTVRRDCSDPGTEPTLDLALTRVYVNQSVPAQDSTQDAAKRIPLVAGRPGLLRVFVGADQANTARPIVRFHYRHDGGPESSIALEGPDSVPTSVDEGVLGDTFNALLPADVIRAGLEGYVVVELVGELDAGNNRFPASGTWAPVVVAVPDANFTVVPITFASVTPAVGDGSAYLGLTQRMLPLAHTDIEIRSPYAFSGDLTSFSEWSRLLTEITALRTTDGSSRHYYGIVDPGYTGGIAGVAWVDGSGGYAAAVGWNLLPSGAEVAAHELGHNWNQVHAPCGGVGNPFDFPHAGGLIGVWGYDMGTETLLSPATHADVMSYCEPVWTSDYTYERILAFRRANGFRELSTAATGPSTVLLVSGRIDHDDDTVDLDPVLATQGRPLPNGGGAYTLVVLDVDGREIARTAFDTVEVSHAHIDGFSLAVPIDPEDAARLGAVRVEAGGRLLLERQRTVRPLATVPTRVTPHPDGGVEIVWDSVAYRELLVRYAGGGEVLGRDRGGRLRVHPDGRPLDLLLSDGLATVRESATYDR